MPDVATKPGEADTNRMLAWGILFPLTVLIGVVLYLAPKEASIGEDGLVHLLPIHNWVAGRGYALFGEPHLIAPPGVGILAYLFYLLSGNLLWSGMLVSSMTYLALAPVLFVLLRPLSGWPGAAVGSLLPLLQPMLFPYVSHPMSELPASLFLVVQFTLAWRCWQMETHWKRFALLGAAVGFGYLLRPELLATGGSALAVLTLRRILHAKEKARLAPLAGWLSMAVLVLPYVLFLSQAKGHLAFSGKGLATLQIIEQRQAPTSEAFSQPASSVGDFFQRMGYQKLRDRLQLGFWRERHILGHWLLPAATVLVVVFLAAWVAAWRRGGERLHWMALRQRWFAVVWLLPCFALPLAVYPFFMVGDRYLLPYQVLFSALLVGLSADLARTFFQKRMVEPTAVALLLAGLGCSLSIHGDEWRNHFHPTVEIHSDIHHAGTWLAAHAQEIPLHQVVSPYRNGLLHFYASGLSPQLPAIPNIHWRGSLDTIAKQMKDNNIQYLLLTIGGTYRNPVLRPLLTMAGRDGTGLSLVHQDSNDEFSLFRLTVAPPGAGE